MTRYEILLRLLIQNIIDYVPKWEFTIKLYVN